jgi:hypothetical protein
VHSCHACRSPIFNNHRASFNGNRHSHGKKHCGDRSDDDDTERQVHRTLSRPEHQHVLEGRCAALQEYQYVLVRR